MKTVEEDPTATETRNEELVVDTGEVESSHQQSDTDTCPNLVETVNSNITESDQPDSSSDQTQ